VGEPRWAYPDWLYISRSEWRRLVRPDLHVGCNQDLQAFGFGAVRRRGDEEGLPLDPAVAGEVLLENTSDGPAGVRVEGWYEGGGAARLSGRVGDATQSAEVAGPAGGDFGVHLPLEAPPGRFTAELRCDAPGVLITAVRAVPSEPSRD
jgi:hypothetical protein